MIVELALGFMPQGHLFDVLHHLQLSRVLELLEELPSHQIELEFRDYPSTNASTLNSSISENVSIGLYSEVFSPEFSQNHTMTPFFESSMTMESIIERWFGFLEPVMHWIKRFDSTANLISLSVEWLWLCVACLSIRFSSNFLRTLLNWKAKVYWVSKNPAFVTQIRTSNFDSSLLMASASALRFWKSSSNLSILTGEFFLEDSFFIRSSFMWFSDFSTFCEAEMYLCFSWLYPFHITSWTSIYRYWWVLRCGRISLFVAVEHSQFWTPVALHFLDECWKLQTETLRLSMILFQIFPQFRNLAFTTHTTHRMSNHVVYIVNGLQKNFLDCPQVLRDILVARLLF